MSLDFIVPQKMEDLCFPRHRDGEKTTKRVRETSRNTVVEKQDQYTVVRKPSQVFQSMTQVTELFRQGKLEEHMFCILKHKDTNAARNPAIPVWEACFSISSSSSPIKAQKSHMKQAYGNAGRLDLDRAMEIMQPSGLPYWVDRHAFSRLSQRATKRRYETKRQGAGGDKCPPP